MGIYANYPLAMAPGMGLNAVVAFQLVAQQGLTWQGAMGVIFLEGVVITVLVLTGFREAVMNAIPMALKRGIAVGIGLFILFIGLYQGGYVRVPVEVGQTVTAPAQRAPGPGELRHPALRHGPHRTHHQHRPRRPAGAGGPPLRDPAHHPAGHRHPRHHRAPGLRRPHRRHAPLPARGPAGLLHPGRRPQPGGLRQALHPRGGADHLLRDALGLLRHHGHGDRGRGRSRLARLPGAPAQTEPRAAGRLPRAPSLGAPPGPPPPPPTSRARRASRKARRPAWPRSAPASSSSSASSSPPSRG